MLLYLLLLLLWGRRKWPTSTYDVIQMIVLALSIWGLNELGYDAYWWSFCIMMLLRRLLDMLDANLWTWM